MSSRQKSGLRRSHDLPHLCLVYTTTKNTTQSSTKCLAMATHYSSMDGPPSAKRSKMEDGSGGKRNDSSYTPTQKENEPQFSVVFSITEVKGGLLRALELCKVSSFPKSRRVIRPVICRAYCNVFVCVFQACKHIDVLLMHTSCKMLKDAEIDASKVWKRAQRHLCSKTADDAGNNTMRNLIKMYTSL